MRLRPRTPLVRTQTKECHSKLSAFGWASLPQLSAHDGRWTPLTAHRRTAFCAGAQRAAAAAALEVQATLPGSSTSCGQARSTTARGRSRRSARELSDTRSRCSFRRRSRRPTPSGTQRRVCSLQVWVRVPGGTLSQQCFRPMSRCAARSGSRASSSHLVAGNARQVHRNDMPDDLV
jgi:hypothetical protein